MAKHIGGGVVIALLVIGVFAVLFAAPLLYLITNV